MELGTAAEVENVFANGLPAILPRLLHTAHPPNRERPHAAQNQFRAIVASHYDRNQWRSRAHSTAALCPVENVPVPDDAQIAVHTGRKIVRSRSQSVLYVLPRIRILLEISSAVEQQRAAPSFLLPISRKC